MIDFNENSKRKTQEYRNLAEFLAITVEEVQELEQFSPSEYSKILSEYMAWCLSKFNERCFSFNEKAKKNMPTTKFNNDAGITA